VKTIRRAVYVFVSLALTPLSAFAGNPEPSAPGILAQSPVQGIIAPATPSPTPSPTPAAAGEVATPSQSPVVEPSPVKQAAADQPPSASGTPAATPTPGSSFQSDLLGGKEPVLDDEERAGVEVTDAWKDRSYNSMVSRAGTNGSVMFRYGDSYPSIVCAILQVTDIELEPGEVVTQVNVGDTTRWSVESAVSGAGTSPMQAVQHLIVKPRDIGLSTSLVVTTDRRTYHLILVSDQTEFMHSVRFVYSDQHQSVAAATPVAAASPAPAPQRAAHDAAPRHTDGETKKVAFVKADPAPVDDTDDGYVVTGRADWKPVSVYSKGGKTYIEMPASVRHKEAPVLFEETRKGWFHHEKILVNYRVKGSWYVVDKVIDKGTLVSGVGTNQMKVDIRHVEGKPAAAPTTEGGK
jgi:type IV secretion system protein TrbG